MSVEGAVTTYYAWVGGQVMAEYEASGTNALMWKMSYVYMGGRLLATEQADGIRYHHPDRLGTRLVTDASDGAVISEQLTMPFGTQVPYGSTLGGDNSWQHPGRSNLSKKRFTSYDRSGATGLDYAVNRFYSSQQGRFSQIDPIGMGAVSLENPQSLNLYSYVQNNPVNSVDPSGLMMVATCYVDGIETDCGFAMRLWASGGGDIIPSGAWRNKRGEWIYDDLPVSDLNDEWRDMFGWMFQSGGGSGRGEPKGGGDGDNKCEVEKVGIGKVGSAATTAAGIGASIGEYLNQIGDEWRGKNGKWNDMKKHPKFTGNQYTGSRADVLKTAAAQRAMGKGVAAVSIGISTAQGVQAIRDKKPGRAAKSGLDIGMTVLGVKGGPPGAAVASLYFAVDTLIGWDNVPKETLRYFSEKTKGLSFGNGRCW